MLKLSNAMTNISVMSLRTGGQVGTAVQMIINPNNLKIEGWYVDDRFSGQRRILLANDVRDIVPQGIAVNDQEVLSEPDELVRLKPILEINFQLTGKQVRSQGGKKYGKVTDFAVETSGLIIKKIYASQAIVKSLSDGNLSIDRTQIVEITNTSIIIEDPTVEDRVPATAVVTAP
ncbi:hypothetical protein KY385_01105 [Candidatus Parcubacteria bacterium]|nr:hypothetical protein [Candidatus Parcubacteria bacterium]